MHPASLDDSVYTQLEERIEKLGQVILRLKSRNSELEKNLQALSKERDAAKDHLAQAQSELSEVRSRNKDAAARVKNLLTQIEQMDLLTEA